MFASHFLPLQAVSTNVSPIEIGAGVVDTAIIAGLNAKRKYL